MEQQFCKLCHSIITNDKKGLNNIKKSLKDNFDDYQKKALKFIKNLRHKTKKYGYNIDFDSFCKLLEEYINKKSNLTDSEKRNYLKILFSLSRIYEINLRSELEPHISTKKDTQKQINRNELFKKFCRYNLEHNDNVDMFNELKSICQKHKLNFDKINQKSISFIEEIKLLTKKQGYNTDIASLHQMIEEYVKQKSNLTDREKASKLRVLLYLSEIYDIDLREQLNEKKSSSSKESNKDIIDSFTNPLEDNDLLAKLLTYRYENGYFNIIELSDSVEEQDFDYSKIQAELAFTIFKIFTDKFNNYAYDDLNPKYSNLITEKELEKLNNITEDEIYHIVTDLNKPETKHYILKKYKITDNLYKFLFLTVNEALNYNKDLIGLPETSLFNIKTENSNIGIYIKGPIEKLYYLINEYIKKCIENNFSYEIKINSSDNYIIILTNKENLEAKINILESINSNIITSLAKPMPMCATNNAYYGIAFSDIDEIPYLEYINNICEVAYYRVLAKIAINKIDEEKAINIIDNFISLNNITFSSSKSNPLTYSYNEVSFTVIKDLINQYIPLIINTLSIYIEKILEYNNFIDEFKKSIKYLVNISRNNLKNKTINIAIV